MPYFDYRARSAAGELMEGRLEAASADAVASQLLAGGATPIRIVEGRDQANWLQTLRQWGGLGTGIKLDDLLLFCRQMFTLIKAGVPIIQALEGLIQNSRNPAMSATLKDILETLRSGRELSTALHNHPRVFPLLFVSIVQVGEATGRLDEAFSQLSSYLEREKETRNRVKEALRYPSFVIVAIGVAMAILTLFVIPVFQKVFRGFKLQLPLPTRIILAVSHFAIAFWPYLLIGGVLAVLGIRQYLKTPEGRLRWDRLKLRLPIVGSILHRATMSRFARAFALSFRSGVPLVEALGITARAVDNAYIESRFELMREGVERGDTLTRTAAATGMFTPLVLQMLSLGEETGALDTVLQDVAEFYEREVDYDLKNLTSSIEPLLIVAIGGMVLVLALGVFLPMWDLTKIAHVH